jgi:NTE family protein
MPSDERMAELMQVIANAMAQGAPPEVRRAAVGRFALESRTAPEEAFLAAFADLRGEAFPAHYACPAVDAVTGAFVVWDADSGTELVRAVASSCAVPGLFAPITIKGRRYIDGGFRSGTNADLAKGHGRVLIVSLLSAARTTGAIDPRMLPAAQLDEEVAILRSDGAEVVVFEADDAGAKAMGANLMNPLVAPIALEEGIRQGEAKARGLAEFWNSSR